MFLGGLGVKGYEQEVLRSGCVWVEVVATTSPRACMPPGGFRRHRHDSGDYGLFSGLVPFAGLVDDDGRWRSPPVGAAHLGRE